MSNLKCCPSCGCELNYMPIDTFKNSHICTNCGAIFKNKTIVNIVSYSGGILLLFLIDSPLRALIAYLFLMGLRFALTYFVGYRLTGEIVKIKSLTEETKQESDVVDIPNYEPSRLIYLLGAFIVMLLLFVLGAFAGSTISDDQHVIGRVMGLFNLVGFLYFQWIMVFVIRGKLYFKIKENLKAYLGYIIAWIAISFLFLYVFDMFTQNGYKDKIEPISISLISLSIVLVFVQYVINRK